MGSIWAVVSGIADIVAVLYVVRKFVVRCFIAYKRRRMCPVVA